MRLVKQPLGEYNTDTFLHKSSWEEIEYMYDKNRGIAYVSAPFAEPIYAPEDSWMGKYDNMTVVLFPKNQTIDKRWVFRNVKLRDDLAAKLDNSRTTQPDGRRVISVLRNEMFAGAGVEQVYTSTMTYGFSVELYFRSKHGVGRNYDPVNATNYWLKNQKRIA